MTKVNEYSKTKLKQKCLCVLEVVEFIDCPTSLPEAQSPHYIGHMGFYFLVKKE